MRKGDIAITLTGTNNKKSYARKLTPSLTKEEYYAGVMMKHGIDSRSIADITAAFLGVTGKSSKERDAEVIAKLEEIIHTLPVLWESPA